MKTLTSLLLASALVAAPIATSYAHQHTDKSDMPMMDSQMMKKMQTHMEEMQAVLDAVKSESDPEKREAMLHEIQYAAMFKLIQAQLCYQKGDIAVDSLCRAPFFVAY